FRTINTSNRGAICFNNAVNKHTQKFSDEKFSLNINEDIDIVSSAINYINLRLDSFLYSINSFPVRIISSFSGLNSEDWGVILSENYKFWYPQRIILSPNLYVQLTSALDLYEGLSENSANPIINNTSSVKLIDLET
ncbi:MAG: hypothetical protein EZS28_029384, partial [Streblomastix strix]